MFSLHYKLDLGLGWLVGCLSLVEQLLANLGCVVISCQLVIADWSPPFLTLFSVVMFGISFPHDVYSSTERGVSFSGRSFSRRRNFSLCLSKRFPHLQSQIFLDRQEDADGGCGRTEMDPVFPTFCARVPCLRIVVLGTTE